ncbi:hypothetical protein P154DRAFT_517193 [Amniculicola lignicola CBS 123094]|uniref:Uncharacterized protein n=1 Tax=Amniculicola lignicola CBS 123094 TaxID=1392246 RepID=A0A6A5X3M9_9PLEO|nr:hypothetical protein P154DRAFT_517193 [Amniculicola lignicola CBS 123094]
MTGRDSGISHAVPEPYREVIRNLTGRIYKDSGNQRSRSINLTAEEADEVLKDIRTAIEQVNSGLKAMAWTEAYTALNTMKEVVQNFTASLAMRRASVGLYDTVWPGSRWRQGGST